MPLAKPCGVYHRSNTKLTLFCPLDLYAIAVVSSLQAYKVADPVHNSGLVNKDVCVMWPN